MSTINTKLILTLGFKMYVDPLSHIDRSLYDVSIMAVFSCVHLYFTSCSL